jgi:hypothetical protein
VSQTVAPQNSPGTVNNVPVILTNSTSLSPLPAGNAAGSPVLTNMLTTGASQANLLVNSAGGLISPLILVSPLNLLPTYSGTFNRIIQSGGGDNSLLQSEARAQNPTPVVPYQNRSIGEGQEAGAAEENPPAPQVHGRPQADLGTTLLGHQVRESSPEPVGRAETAQALASEMATPEDEGRAVDAYFAAQSVAAVSAVPVARAGFGSDERTDQSPEGLSAAVALALVLGSPWVRPPVREREATQCQASRRTPTAR